MQDSSVKISATVCLAWTPDRVTRQCGLKTFKFYFWMCGGSNAFGLDRLKVTNWKCETCRVLRVKNIIFKECRVLQQLFLNLCFISLVCLIYETDFYSFWDFGRLNAFGETCTNIARRFKVHLDSWTTESPAMSTSDKTPLSKAIDPAEGKRHF